MRFERFSRGTSPLHRRDARGKIISACALILVLALCRDYRTALAGVATGLAFLAVAKLPVRQVAMRILAVNTFVGFLWVTLPLTYPGSALAAAGPLSFSEPGVALALLITLKANAAIMLVIALLATSSIADIGHALDRLKLPTKLCLLVLFSYRYVFVIGQEYQRLLRAAKIRCFQPGTNLHTYRTFGYLFGMTLLKSYGRAERVRQAMVLRGFQGSFHPLDRSVLDGGDAVLLAFSAFAASLLAAVELF